MSQIKLAIALKLLISAIQAINDGSVVCMDILKKSVDRVQLLTICNGNDLCYKLELELELIQYFCQTQT